VSILGRGDLSPPRRGRYGHRPRRWPRVLLVLVVLAALGAGGWFGWRHLRDNGSSTARTTTSPCPVVTPTPTLPPVSGRPVQVLNGNLRPGLAARVAGILHRRYAVRIGRVGNAARFVRGASQVRYPAQLTSEARAIAAMVVPAPRLVAAAGLTRVQLDLGTRFRRVATQSEYHAAAVRLGVGPAVPVGSSTSPSGGSPTPTAGCTTP
jgi:hypothetical protein